MSVIMVIMVNPLNPSSSSVRKRTMIFVIIVISHDKRVVVIVMSVSMNGDFSRRMPVIMVITVNHINHWSNKKKMLAFFCNLLYSNSVK